MKTTPLFLALLVSLLPASAQEMTETQPEAPAAQSPAETATAPATTPAAPAAATATPTPAADNPAPSDEFSQKVLPAEPPKKAKPIPTSSGEKSGPVWIGHRSVVDRYAGWGWVKKEKESWNQAKWVAMEETIGKSVAPGRNYSRPTQDDGMTYRLFGDFADYKAYEPNYDVFIDVFRIRGWETVGREEIPKLSPPRGSTGGPPRFSERGANLRR